MTDKLTPAQLRKIPKVELHRHLDGSIRFDTIRQLAQYHNLDLGVKSADELFEKTVIKEPMNNLEDVLNAFWTGQKVLCSYEALKQVTYENIEDAYNDGVRLLELRFAPVYIAHNKQLALDEIFEGVIDGLTQGMEKFGIQVGLIHIIPRGLDNHKHQDSVNEFLRYRKSHHKNADRLCGFDLADSETSTPFSQYIPLVEQVREEGAGITIHTGENTDAQHVRKSIETYSPHRIGHGIKSIEDPELMTLLKERQIHLEINPTSNWLTHSVENIENHPLGDFYHAGIPISLNSDDPQLMGIDLVREYEIAHHLFGLSGEQLFRLNQDAIGFSFLDKSVREHAYNHFFNT
jgi:adenosine deaminase